MSAQLSRDDWKGRVGGLSYRNQAFIGGKFAPSLTGKTFDCVNPGDRPGPDQGRGLRARPTSTPP